MAPMLLRRIGMVKFLIEHGADITAKDNEAVRLTAENGKTEMVRLLIEHGATLP